MDGFPCKLPADYMLPVLLLLSCFIGGVRKTGLLTKATTTTYIRKKDKEDDSGDVAFFVGSTYNDNEMELIFYSSFSNGIMACLF